MTTKELYNLIEKELLPECMRILKSKGLSYSGKEEALGNFKRCAELLKEPVERIWFVYFVKHFDSLCSHIRDEYTDSEPIRGRIIDLINYLFIFAGILKEKGKL